MRGEERRGEERRGEERRGEERRGDRREERGERREERGERRDAGAVHARAAAESERPPHWARRSAPPIHGACRRRTAPATDTHTYTQPSRSHGRTHAVLPSR